MSEEKLIKENIEKKLEEKVLNTSRQRLFSHEKKNAK